MSIGLPDLRAHPTSYADAMKRGLVRAKCLNVTDGDTADFLLDLGWYQYTYERLRVRGLDTPELHAKEPAARRAAERARARACELVLERFAPVRTLEGKKSFDRFVADVWIPAPAARAPEGVRCVVVPRGQRWWSLAEMRTRSGRLHRVSTRDG